MFYCRHWPGEGDGRLRMTYEFRRPYTISKAARALNISIPSARAAVPNGELEAFRIGKATRILAESVERRRRGERPADRRTIVAA
jgi:excisionase family DNA binding protein